MIEYEGEEEGGYELEKERVAIAKGATLLDRILPGWYKKVNLKRLEMSHGSMCMMGQLFGNGVESKLAREMYPEEMARVEDESNFCNDDGYGKALYTARGRGPTLIETLMAKMKVKTGLETLKHVCKGHDNKCLWAEAVADRLASDKVEG